MLTRGKEEVATLTAQKGPVGTVVRGAIGNLGRCWSRVGESKRRVAELR